MEEAASAPSPSRAAFPGTTGGNPIGLRRPRRAIIVFAGGATENDEAAQVLERSLVDLGLDARYVGRADDAARIASLVTLEGADAVEVCLSPGSGAVRFLRDLLRVLIEMGRRDVSIVVHRVRG
jgi:methylmalonyl-CoA mutase cobalamin-binding subunit